MKKVALFFILILLVFNGLWAKGVTAQKKKLNPKIEAMVASITEAEAEEKLRKLMSWGSRYSNSNACQKACEWARDKFIEWGLDSVYLDKFSSSQGPNVVGILKGTKQVQDSIFITGAHIDTKGPGADDNGSGTILTMLNAKAMSKYTFRNDVRFVLFNAEEVGILGSGDYARKHRRDKIKGVLTHDMCLWWKRGDKDFQMEVKRDYRWLAEAYEKIGEDYVDLELTVDPPSG